MTKTKEKKNPIAMKITLKSAIINRPLLTCAHGVVEDVCETGAMEKMNVDGSDGQSRYHRWNL
jgi:hypothetical protein